MSSRLAGVILAGGLSHRMGGEDKFLKICADKPLIAYAIDCLKSQIDHLALNINGDYPQLTEFLLPFIADTIPGHLGPLAGILSGMEWAHTLSPAVSYIVTVPSDTPFLPKDLCRRLCEAKGSQTQIVLAASKGKVHATVGLWSIHLKADLYKALVHGNVRKVVTWAQNYKPVIVEFPVSKIDPFFNINTQRDLMRAARSFTAGHVE
ncbi:MAG: molybdenum cofactor guanylyltransferase MobA [Alphaproteobacteria bacterium]